MSSMVTSGAVIGAAPEMVPLVERSIRFVASLKLYIHIGSDALPYDWNVSIVVPSVQSFAPPVLPTHPVEPSYVLPMRTERAMPSKAMFRLFMTDCSACAFLFAFTSARSAPTETTITMENSPMATIISTRVNPRDELRAASCELPGKFKKRLHLLEAGSWKLEADFLINPVRVGPPTLVYGMSYALR